eukprot:12823722-Alexandrium_andersonii.AAC.1
MSASLVGSEMCIRDRVWRRPMSVCARVCALVESGVPRLRRGMCASMSSCLLYTSDAADDM